MVRLSYVSFLGDGLFLSLDFLILAMRIEMTVSSDLRVKSSDDVRRISGRFKEGEMLRPPAHNRIPEGVRGSPEGASASFRPDKTTERRMQMKRGEPGRARNARRHAERAKMPGTRAGSHPRDGNTGGPRGAREGPPGPA